MLSGRRPSQHACIELTILLHRIVLIYLKSGNAFLCSEDGLYLFVTNLVNGIDQYRFPSLEKVQSFPHVIENNHPLQISTIAKGSLIVCGGDNGFARMFSRRTGQLIQRLEHEKCKCTLIDRGSLLRTISARKQVSIIAVWLSLCRLFRGQMAWLIEMFGRRTL